MQEPEAIRRRVWDELRRVAQPDSRFHWDFTAFIPDYAGSAQCTAAVCALPAFSHARTLLVTPDNNLAALRAQCLADEKNLVVPTYALARGFWQITRAEVPPGQEAFAATLDGLERFARPFAVEAAGAGAAVELLVTGASVINTQGVRISSGPSYFDLEWLILRTLGLVSDATLVVAVVHDCQLVDWPCVPQPFGCVADVIVTPTRVFETGQRYRKPERIAWDQLDWEVIQDVPLLMALYERDRAA
jgi:5-formyltetrahydrofolate cyclo-ligase